MNVECRSEICCKRLDGNTGRKNSPSEHHRTTLSGYIFTTKADIDNRKKNLLSSNISSRCPYNMVNFGLLTAEIDWQVCWHPIIFQRVSRLGFVTAWHSWYWASATLCGVEQRAPPIFGRAAITLGTGPHF